MAKTLTAVRLSQEVVDRLQKWADAENRKKDGPPWSVSYLIQRAVDELLDRNKK